jgi:hypothetical protein
LHLRRLRERLTFANVTAGLALFIALGGTSYAAITLPRNSVGTNQLRTGAIRSVDVKDRSLEARDLSLKARRFLKGQKGEQGERGPQGPAGPTGPSGGGGGGGSTSVVITTETATGTVAFGEVASATATCGAGRRVTGGGVRVDSASDTSARESYPNVNNTAWTVRVGNDDTSGGPFTFTVFAICAG